MSPVAALQTRLNEGFPRVSGDEPGDQMQRITMNGFSPRERG